MKSVQTDVPRAGLEVTSAAQSDAADPCGWKECPAVPPTDQRYIHVYRPLCNVHVTYAPAVYEHAHGMY